MFKTFSQGAKNIVKNSTMGKKVGDKIKEWLFMSKEKLKSFMFLLSVEIEDFIEILMFIPKNLWQWPFRDKVLDGIDRYNPTGEGVLGGYTYKIIGVVDGIRILYSPGFVRSTDCILGLMTWEGDERVVFLDDHFFDLSYNARAQVLYHEIGHCKDENVTPENTIVSYHKRFDCVEEGYVEEEEAFADDYAVKKIGRKKSQKALMEIAKHISKYTLTDSSAIKELDLRINRLN